MKLMVIVYLLLVMPLHWIMTKRNSNNLFQNKIVSFVWLCLHSIMIFVKCKSSPNLVHIYSRKAFHFREGTFLSTSVKMLWFDSFSIFCQFTLRERWDFCSIWKSTQEDICCQKKRPYNAQAHSRAFNLFPLVSYEIHLLYCEMYFHYFKVDER